MDYSLLLAIEENPHYRKHAVTLKKLSQHSNSLGVRTNSMKSGNSQESNNLPLNENEGMMPHHKFKQTRHMFLSSNLQYIYHLSIIDYLQDYNLDKKLEHFAKTIIRGKKAEISAVPPERYLNRYIKFMESEVIISDKKNSSDGSGPLGLDKIEEEKNNEESKESNW